MLSSVERWLVDGGVFVMVVEHPLVTAVKPRPDRAALPEHTTLTATLERYLDEGQLMEQWFTDGVIKYHRVLGTWVSAIASAGVKRAILRNIRTELTRADVPVALPCASASVALFLLARRGTRRYALVGRSEVVGVVIA